MSYATTGLKCLNTPIGGGPNQWYYASADAHTDVDASGYFSDGVTRGMKVGDTVLVVNTSGYTITQHAVASVSGDAATISAAVLA